MPRRFEAIYYECGICKKKAISEATSDIHSREYDEIKIPMPKKNTCRSSKPNFEFTQVVNMDVCKKCAQKMAEHLAEKYKVFYKQNGCDAPFIEEFREVDEE